MNLTGLSQSDKLVDFARNAAQFLLRLQTDAFGLVEAYEYDAAAIRDALVAEPNMGYGLKKANMFVRDMVAWGVWRELSNLPLVDVASDRNTMRVALRTRVLQTGIPLLSSFLDIFCHQYVCIDAASAEAWRAVWWAWAEKDPQGAPVSPCLMDFLLYRIGRDYCKHALVRYQCTRGHTFYHFGARLRICRMCRAEGHQGEAWPTEHVLPCQAVPEELPRDDDGRLLISEQNLLYTLDGRCPFDSVCQPRSASFRAYEAPRPISVKGQTGWIEAYAERDMGGGGLMS